MGGTRTGSPRSETGKGAWAPNGGLLPEDVGRETKRVGAETGWRGRAARRGPRSGLDRGRAMRGGAWFRPEGGLKRTKAPSRTLVW